MKTSFSTRNLIQLVSLLSFTLLLFLTTYPLNPSVPSDLFLRLDPLVAVGSFLGSGNFPVRLSLALVTIILTVLGGRLFCGYLCPLGAVIDLGDTLTVGKKKKAPGTNRRYRKLRNGKYYLLLVVVISGVLGFSLLFAFDPISLLTRTFTAFLYPLAIFLANLFLDFVRPLADRLGFLGLVTAHFAQPVYGGNFITFFLVAGILLLGYLSRRFWCRYLCPLGALLAVLSRPAPVRRKVENGCTDCGLCQSQCPMDAIGEDARKTAQSECIGCRICARVCPENVVRFVWVWEGMKKYRSEVDFTRRGFIYATGMALALPFLAHTSLVRARIERKTRLLRPPGALPEKWFNRTCIRCGECVKSCITNTLQPSAFEAGLEGLWTPRHDMRLAGCEQACNVCGRVCPTQAIRALSLEEKRHARIGTAVLLRDRCIAWEQDRLCLICDEACPYNAIVFQTVAGQKRPCVDELKCNGCGICEQVCPIFGESAIVVEPMGQIRLREGSYIEEAKLMKFDFQHRELKDKLDETMSRSIPRSRFPVERTQDPTTKGPLPPGFLSE